MKVIPGKREEVQESRCQYVLLPVSLRASDCLSASLCFWRFPVHPCICASSRLRVYSRCFSLCLTLPISGLGGLPASLLSLRASPRLYLCSDAPCLSAPLPVCLSLAPPCFGGSLSLCLPFPFCVCAFPPKCMCPPVCSSLSLCVSLSARALPCPFVSHCISCLCAACSACVRSFTRHLRASPCLRASLLLCASAFPLCLCVFRKSPSVSRVCVFICASLCLCICVRFPVSQVCAAFPLSLNPLCP